MALPTRLFAPIIAALAMLTPSHATIAADAPPEVMLVATYHFSNPGRDLNNVEAVDVTTPERQKEIIAITNAIARFAPTFVAVEWPADVVDERYPQYLDGTRAPSTNEVEQLGFRLAKQLKLERVHGLDVDGEFPFEAVQTWAKANGRDGEIAAMMKAGGAEVAKMTALQHEGTLGGVLRYVNSDAAIAANHAFYPKLLTFGAGDEQPGVAVLASWYTRNVHICARLLQAMKPGERAVAFYGQGHVYLIRQCLREAGVRMIDPLDYLPR